MRIHLVASGDDDDRCINLVCHLPDDLSNRAGGSVVCVNPDVRDAWDGVVRVAILGFEKWQHPMTGQIRTASECAHKQQATYRQGPNLPLSKERSKALNLSHVVADIFWHKLLACPYDACNERNAALNTAYCRLMERSKCSTRINLPKYGSLLFSFKDCSSAPSIM
jgi:hypothetical protein